MYTNFQEYLKQELAQIKADGLYKHERIKIGRAHV